MQQGQQPEEPRIYLPPPPAVGVAPTSGELALQQRVRQLEEHLEKLGTFQREMLEGQTEINDAVFDMLSDRALNLVKVQRKLGILGVANAIMVLVLGVVASLAM